MWEDFWIGMRHHSRGKRIVVVTDLVWIRPLVQLFGFLPPKATSVFTVPESGEARARLSQDS